MTARRYRFEHDDDVLEITVHENGETDLLTNFPESVEDFDEDAPEEDVAYTIGYLRGVQNVFVALAEAGVDLTGDAFSDAFAVAVDNLVDDDEDEDDDEGGELI
jgi:hypothetical protein